MAKRVFDLVLAVLALVLLSPALLVSWIGVRTIMGAPVLFRQVRAGRDGIDFRLFKFRSMKEANGPNGLPLPDEERVTGFGRFLRRSRLDELPELLLVLSGAMSFVGPRPLPRALLEAAGVLDQRCRVRPGLTGLSQVSGNTLLSGDEKFAMDLWYNAHRSIAMDAAILVKTLATVIGGERRNEALIARAMDAYGPNRRGW